MQKYICSFFAFVSFLLAVPCPRLARTLFQAGLELINVQHEGDRVGEFIIGIMSLGVGVVAGLGTIFFCLLGIILLVIAIKLPKQITK